MSKPQKPSLTLKRHIKTNPEKVFQAWTHAEGLKAWFGPGKITVISAKTDLHIGGHYSIVIRDADGEEHRVGGAYIEIVTNERLVFSWAWESTPERESVVTIALAARDGGTDLTLLHEKFFDSTARDQHEKGWTSCLSKLEALFGNAHKLDAHC